LNTHEEIENLDFDEIMHSRASDAKGFDLEEDRESIKRKMKNLAIGDESYKYTGRDNVTDDDIGFNHNVNINN